MDTYSVLFNSGASHRPFYWKTHPLKIMGTKFWLEPYRICNIWSSLRYIPLKHKLAWLLKPVLSVIDYQLLNSFLLRKEIRPSREKPEYRNFILKVAQGFCANSLKRPTPLKVRNRTFSRSECKLCHDIDPYKDSRTSKYCDRWNSATCSNHAKILCRQCFAS